MELILQEALDEKKHGKALYELLLLGDKEFIPPLSSRSSTTQQGLSGQSTTGGIDSYYNEMKGQCFVLALEGERLAGFMSYRIHYENAHLPTDENLYASTCVVHPDFRGQGLMRAFYTKMIESYPTLPIFTRTWDGNVGHLKVLDRLGFSLLETLENDRGPGIHTVYYGREAK